MRTLAYAAILLPGIIGPARAADTCDRAYLEGFINQHLAALTAGDPGKLSLAPHARHTENAQGRHPVILSLRLKIADCKISEIGVLALRKSSGVFSEPPNLAENVRERRFPVDEERGLILPVVRFDHAGHNKTIRWADGSEHKVNPPFDQSYSFFIDELFKVSHGKINRIEALATPVPYGMYTGWPTK